MNKKVAFEKDAWEEYLYWASNRLNPKLQLITNNKLCLFFSQIVNRTNQPVRILFLQKDTKSLFFFLPRKKNQR